MTALTRLTAMAEEALGLAEKASAEQTRNGGRRFAFSTPQIVYGPADVGLMMRARTLLPQLAAAVQAMAPVVEAARELEGDDGLLSHLRLSEALTALDAKIKELTDG